MNTILLVMFMLLLCIGYFVVIHVLPFIRVSVGARIPRYENPQKALLVIDIQKDLTEEGRKGTINIEQTDPMIDKVNQVIEYADSAGFNIAYVRHEFKKGIITRLLTRGVLAEGSEGAEINSRIAVKNSNIFVKYVMDSFSNKDLQRFLIHNQVNHLYLTGVDAEDCIDKTLKAARNRGYKVTVIEDCVATKTDSRRDMKLIEFVTFGADLIKTERLLIQ